MHCSGMPRPSHTAMAARAFCTLKSPGMVSRNSRLKRGVLTRKRMSWPCLRTWEPNTAAAGSCSEKVRTLEQCSRAALRTRGTSSASRFTTARSEWAKIFSLEAK